MTNSQTTINLPPSVASDIEADIAAVKSFAQALLFVCDGQPNPNSEEWQAVHRLAGEISLRADKLYAVLGQPKAAA